ncbi:MAG: DNA repair protein RecN [Bacteroidetes bacterium]|nr:DNA repair protein RecN [Bacteroidota bacterium]
MLLRLFIQNYAIIEEIEIEFTAGFVVITGETGAGKSILMGAMGLILGERAETSVLANKDKKLVVEGRFDCTHNSRVAFFLKDQELEENEIVIVRREISPQGKSRAFINDTPVNLSQLQELSALLVDLHQQFDTLSLGQSSFQREVLDALAQQLDKVELYKLAYQEWVLAKTTLSDLLTKRSRVEAETAYIQFQYQELEDAGFCENELEELEQEVRLLSNAESVQQFLGRTTASLSAGEEPMVGRLKSLLNEWGSFTSFHSDFPGLAERLRTVYIELQELARDIERVADTVLLDPQRLEEIHGRLSLGYKLYKKHQVNSTAGLLAIQSNLATDLKGIEHLGQAIQELQQQLELLEQKAMALAGVISKGRKKQVSSLESNVQQLLQRVGMPTAQLKVTIETGSLGSEGMDHIDFLFDANRSGQFNALRKVASGGELSRLMLCIKSLVAESMQLPTLIFDEIDTGIAGEAARQVGLLLKELAQHRQVICITHQPQIAGKARTHFFVFKQAGLSSTGAVQTSLRLLSQEERVLAIAQMIGGEAPTPAALTNARELLN